MIGPDKSEKIMWFSMWFLASIVTFGIAFFPLFYRSIERRNKHFKRQHEVEERATRLLTDEEWSLQCEEPPLQRNAKLWTASIILVVPAFVTLYVLSKDLMMHEKRQQIFLKRMLPHMNYTPQRISIDIHIIITVLTLGLAGIYWLYSVFNGYNNHFRDHRIIDDELDKFVEAESHGESV